MTQGLAILTDSLRLLRSRHLFWLCLGLSVLASIVLFGTYSFNERGLRILLFKTWENPDLSAGSEGARTFVTYMFNSIFVGFWLSWGAIILGVLSTASILPEFLSSGSIELYLSKPVSRLSLLLWRALGSLLFVLVQSAVGVLVAYALMGLKFGIWIHEALWAIPLLTLQFFYLYSVSALLAVLTRSTLACVIGTMLFWLGIFVVQFSSNQLVRVSGETGKMIELARSRAESIERRAVEGGRAMTDGERRAIEQARDTVDRMTPMYEPTARWSAHMETVKLVIPKTGDIQKIIANLANAPTVNELAEVTRVSDAGDRHMADRGMSQDEILDAKQAGAAGARATRAVDAAKSIISSSVFSLTMLGIAAIAFRRRDF